MEHTASLSSPKLSLTTLEVKNNYYVVPANGLFHYFPIKIDEETEDKSIMRFEKTPPILIDGIVIYQKKLYEITAKDILRCRIFKSREITTKRETHGSAGSQSGSTTDPTESPTTNPINTAGTEAVRYKIEQSPLRGIELEISEAADLVWEEQIESLLGIVSSKEGGEWEITDAAQP